MFFVKFFEKVDKIDRSRDVDLLEDIVELLHKGNEKISKSYKNKKEDMETTSSNWKI